MVQVTKKSALDYNVEHARHPEELDQLLDAVIDTGGIGTDSEFLEQSGAYAHIRQTAQAVESVAKEVLTTFAQQSHLEKESREREHAKLLSAIKDTIKSHPTQIEKRWQIIAWCSSGVAAGFVLSLLFTWLFVFPQQLRLARGGDAALLQKLNTPEGELFRRAFYQGQLTMKECVAKARKRKMIKTSQGKTAKIPCTVDLNV
ncbi:hypothetical protein [Merismopedia glauca]|uniref:Uncharacterized protein n=1 Tax=Merismopedia glauca CCAP 1448/3 TaxID=1296344 RepID=A0A2T1C268_9CYAN|nr:hypothetical protein [Merismopedia glauca]PSB02375.1 hypothetical protein C7B64_13395 [Merismopedia glauca CCAP 1448/3]